jgi:hypothetical protein
MGKLRGPSSDLSKRILTQVDFEHRLEGFSLREQAKLYGCTVLRKLFPCSMPRNLVWILRSWRTGYERLWAIKSSPNK